jgi:hypothetical protein
MTDENKTLTLTASGPATVREATTEDGMDITTTRTREMTAEVAVDGNSLTTHGDVYREGVVLLAKDIGHEVADRRSSEAVTFCVAPDQADEWSLELTGTVEEWLSVATDASDRHTVGSQAEQAVHILDTLADRGGIRARLAILDLMDRYDIEPVDRAGVLNSLRDVDEFAADTDSVEADD